MKYIVVLAMLLMTGISAASAQDAGSASREFGLYYTDLRSTHMDHFTGVTGVARFPVAKHLLLGGGVEYTWNDYHDDNGWTLTNLRFLPVYLAFRYVIDMNKSIRFEGDLDNGLSFNSYDKYDPQATVQNQHINELGYYAYAGVGMQVKLAGMVYGEMGIGVKGYKMSFNNLDVNPHGLNGRIGVILRN